MGKDLKGKELGTGLSQRKDGRYSARFVNKHHQRKEHYDYKLQACKIWLANAKYEDDHGLLGTGEKISVNEWFYKWAETYKKNIVSYHTYQGYLTNYKQHIQPHIGHMQVSKVKKIDCQNILNRMYEQKYAYGTMREVRKYLRAIFQGAVEEEIIIKNPLDKVLVPYRETKERPVLTREEQEIFVRYIVKYEHANALLFILQTGLRIGEIIALTWKDIDIEKQELNIKRTFVAKGEEGYIFGPTKTKSGTRQIPLTETAIEIIKNEREKNPPKREEDYIFTTKRGNPIIPSIFVRTMKYVRNKINKEIKKGKIEISPIEVITPHTLRHTYATRCIENGMNPKILQKILGHSSIGITMNLYVHVTEEELKKSIKEYSPEVKIER